MNDAGELASELTAERLDERLDGYRVLREVGRGAMGNVYEVMHERLRSSFALKQLRAQRHEVANAALKRRKR